MASPTDLLEESDPPVAGRVYGREAEVGTISRLFDRIGETGSALVVRGEAGIGKSTLLSAASDGARSRGFAVLLTWGVHSERDLPFAGLHHLVHPLLDGTDHLPAPQANAVLRAFGMVDGPPAEPFLVALATLNLLADHASSQPVLVVADEADALDRPSADALAFVARRLESDPIVLIAAVRDGLDSPLIDARLPQLRLRGVDDDAGRSILAAASRDLAEPVRKRLLAEAVGNPLALIELSSALEPRQATGRTPLPARLRLTDRLEASFATRIGSLPGTTQQLLLLVAAVDRGGVADIIAAAVDTGIDATEGDLEPALNIGLVTVEDRVIRFRHPLVQSAVYQRASDDARRAAHAALAVVMRDDPDRRAAQLALAAGGPDEAVAGELVAAAERAGARGGVAVAATILERAADLTPDPTIRLGRRLRAAEMAMELGRVDMAARIVREVDPPAADTVDRARLTLVRELTESETAVGGDRIIQLVETADRVSDSGEANLALSLLWAATLRLWRSDPGPKVRQRIVEVVERLDLGDDPRVVAILAAAAPGTHGADVLERLRERGSRLEDDQAALRFLGAAAMTVGDFPLAEMFLAAAVAALRVQGRLGLLAQTLNLHAWASTSTRSLELAAAHAEESRRLATETSQPLWAIGATVTLANIAGMRGNDAEANELGSSAERALAPGQGADVLADLQMGRGVAALLQRDHAGAYQHLSRIFDRDEPAFHPHYQSWAIADLVEAAVGIGHEDEAREAVRQMRQVEAELPSLRTQLALMRARAWIVPEADVDSAYAAALDRNLDGWPFHRGRLHLAYGEWLRRQRRVIDARRHLREARDVFETFGAVAWGERARRELRATGEASRRRAPGAFDQLTPQELQIARLAAQGLTNREIGEQLYLSHRTIGFHLYQAFPKLGVTSRAELAAALQEQARPAGS